MIKIVLERDADWFVMSGKGKQSSTPRPPCCTNTLVTEFTCYSMTGKWTLTAGLSPFSFEVCFFALTAKQPTDFSTHPCLGFTTKITDAYKISKLYSDASREVVMMKCHVGYLNRAHNRTCCPDKLNTARTEIWTISYQALPEHVAIKFRTFSFTCSLITLKTLDSL